MKTFESPSLEQKEALAPKEVVRIFLLQPIAPESISTNEDLENVYLHQVVMIKKNKQSNNPGQIMPIGGNVEDNEDVSGAARREALEETHLDISLKELQTKQNYNFIHHGEEKSRHATFFLGELFAPKFDIPYPLNNTVDKIGGFVSLNLAELGKLFEQGESDKGALLDSLNTNEVRRSELGTIANTEEIKNIQNELQIKLRYAEMQSKLHALEKILHSEIANATPDQKEKIEALRRQYEALMSQEKDEGIIDLFTEIQTFWKSNIVAISGGYENAQSVLRFINTENILQDLGFEKNTERKKGKGVPTIHMMFPVMFGLEFDQNLKPLLESNLHLATLHDISKVLYLYNTYPNDLETSKKGATDRLLRKFLGLGKNEEITEEGIIEFFKKKIGVEYETLTSFGEMADEVDAFFDDLQKQTKVSPSVASLSHINEVAGKDFERVVKLAFSKGEDITTKQIKFEAQRKLLLVHMLFEVKKYYQGVKRKGIQSLDDLEASLEVSGKNESPLEKTKRTLSLQGNEYQVLIERNPKELRSLIRKVLVRDEWDFTETSAYNDIYREAYIFDTSAKDAVQEEERLVPCFMTNGKDAEIKTYRSLLVVHQFISELVQKAEENGESVEIVQFKELPKKGEGFASSGVAGGAQVQMCKFYIKHTDSKNVQRMREVQMFFPKQDESGAWVSGEVDYLYKKNDDAQYSLQRLFTHGSAYSVIELLFPHHVYGDKMKAMFSVDKEES